MEFVQKSPDNAATANFAISKSLKIQTPLSFASSTLYRNTKHISESKHRYGVMEINIRIRIYRITLQDVVREAMDDKDLKPIFSISFTKGEPVATGLHCKGWLKLFSFNSNLCWESQLGMQEVEMMVMTMLS